MSVEHSVTKLYNEIQSMGFDCVCLTSSSNGEGVTTIAHMLAKLMAQANVKTVLINCCLKVLKSESSGQAWQSVIKEQDDQYSLLELAKLGERFANDKLEVEALLTKLRQEYDLVIIDAPAVGTTGIESVLNDTLVEKATATILVVMAGVTTSTRLKESVAKLVRTGGNLIGTVINDYLNPKLVDELCRETHRLDKFAPNKMHELRNWLKKNQLLNLEI